MTCAAEAAGSDASAHVRLLRRIGERLEAAHALADRSRGYLARADAAAIEQATAELETVGQEFKVLVEEYGRLPAPESRSAAERGVARERGALAALTERLARDSAVAGGLLERMLTVSRGLLGLVSLARDGTYLPTGRAAEFAPQGLRLRERL
jgi:hypothetical protein